MVNFTILINEVPLALSAVRIINLQFSQSSDLSWLNSKLIRRIDAILIVATPGIHLLVVFENVSVSLIQRDGLYRSIQLYPPILFLTVRMKSVNPILIRHNSCEFIIEIYINGIFILLLKILLQRSIF